MRWRSFPVLAEADREIVAAMTVGLPRDAARVLAYLRLRQREPETDAPASRLEIRIGTELGRDRTIDALTRLEDRELVESTTTKEAASGRPPKAWRAAAGTDTIDMIHRQHAARLVDSALARRSDGGGDEPHLPSPEAMNSPPVDSNEPVRVALNWEPNGLQAPLFVADAAGTYDHHGVSVTFDASTGSRAAIDEAASGAADIALTGSATLCDAETDLLPVALLYQRPVAIVYTTEDAFGGRLQTADQLSGRRIGMPARSETGKLARLFLSQANVLSDVSVVPVAGEERSALLEGEVDAVTGIVTDAEEVEANGYDVSSLSIAETFPFPGPALAARSDVIADRRASLVGFLAATMNGLVTARRDPGAAGAAVTEYGEVDVDSERRKIERVTEGTTERDVVREHGWGWSTTETWNRLETALARADGTDEPV